MTKPSRTQLARRLDRLGFWLIKERDNSWVIYDGYRVLYAKTLREVAEKVARLEAGTATIEMHV